MSSSGRRLPEMAERAAQVTGGRVADEGLEAVAKALVRGPDARITRVTALIDSLPERGGADAVIAPLRGRLRQIRPPRPLRFERLLFLPLDPLIVAPAHWTPGQPAVPRPVIAPLARVVRDRLGGDASDLSAALEGRDLGEESVVSRFGTRLWPAAARVLAQAPEAPVRDAVASGGVPEAAAGALLAAVVAVLGQAPRLHALNLEIRAGRPARPETLQLALDAAAAGSVDTWNMMLALLLARVPEAQSVLRVAETRAVCWGDPALTAATERAAELALCRLESAGQQGGRIANGELTEAVAELERTAALLDGLAADRKVGQERYAALRRHLEVQCRARFEGSLCSELLEPLLTLAPGSDSGAVMQLEATARELRRFEGRARGIGGAEEYDDLLLAAAEQVHAIKGDGSLSLADKVRMVEILAGPEEALKLLEG